MCGILKFQKNGNSVNDISIKIKYRDNIKNDYMITKAVQKIEMKIGNTLVDSISDFTDVFWNNENELIIPFNFKYSNGFIIFNECKYFDITIKIVQHDYYFVESTKIMIKFHD